MEARHPKNVRQPINARAETIATNPMFRTVFTERRCLVPADAFLWEHWRGDDGEIVRTFAIITTKANAPVRAVHDRMPVILDPEDWMAWLEGPDPGSLLRPAADDVLRLWPISRAVNPPRNNGPELLEEHTPPPAPRGWTEPGLAG